MTRQQQHTARPRPPLPHLMGSGRGKATDSISVYARQRFSLGQKNNKPYRKLSAAFPLSTMAIYRCTLLLLSPSLCVSLPLSLCLSPSACPCQNHKFYWPNCRANYAANKWPIMKPLSKSAPTNWQSQHLSFPYTRRDYHEQQEQGIAHSIPWLLTGREGERGGEIDSNMISYTLQKKREMCY